jgi:hypothetical protein
MSNGTSTHNGWSKIFKSPNQNKGNSSKNKNLGEHLYSDNPFHRPPSAASDVSETTFRTGTAYQSGSSGGSKDRLGDKGSLHSGHSGGKSGYAESTMSALDLDDDGECPVCLEPLSFSFKLPGEKPHVVPECGHALHEVSLGVLFPSLRFPR